MKKYWLRAFFTPVAIAGCYLQTAAQNYSQKDEGLVTYKLGTDTTFSQYFQYNNRKFHTVILALTGSVTKKELKVGSNVMGRLKLFVDEKGRMQGGDAIGSSLNWLAYVEREKKDYPDYLDKLGKRKLLTGNLAPRTFRDTARLALENKK